MNACSKRLLISFGLLLVGAFSANAQALEHRVSLGESGRSTAMPAPAPPVAAETRSTLSTPEFHRLDLNSEDHRSVGVPLLEVTRTPFMTESRVPLAQTAGQRVQLNFFVQSLHNKNITQGPLVLAQTNQQLGQQRTSDLYGVGFSIPLGRDAGSAGSKSVWSGLSRVLRGK
ncbi:MAG TPA: hypothetical protein VN846_08010 [Candidatus Cybelea sp.]|jgi:hypothetical protein|nr:hypothetical protein [Candidatus Cybelea sp.]